MNRVGALSNFKFYQMRYAISFHIKLKTSLQTRRKIIVSHCRKFSLVFSEKPLYLSQEDVKLEIMEETKIKVIQVSN